MLRLSLEHALPIISRTFFTRFIFFVFFTALFLRVNAIGQTEAENKVGVYA